MSAQSSALFLPTDSCVMLLCRRFNLDGVVLLLVLIQVCVKGERKKAGKRTIVPPSLFLLLI